MKRYFVVEIEFTEDSPCEMFASDSEIEQKCRTCFWRPPHGSDRWCGYFGEHSKSLGACIAKDYQHWTPPAHNGFKFHDAKRKAIAEAEKQEESDEN